jgi:hypothetical protein
MANRLEHLVIHEVSSVDKGSNPHARIVLLKRDDGAMTPEDALSASISSGMDDDDVVDKAGWVEQQLKDYRAHKSTMAKGAGQMDQGLENMLMIAKTAISTRSSMGLEKWNFIEAITKRADEIRAKGETAAQAFAKTITQDEAGRALFAASKLAPGTEVKPLPITLPLPPPPDGPAHAEMQSLAEDHLRAHPQLSSLSDGGKAAAFSAVYSSPKNYALREQVKAEHLAGSLAKMNA